MMPRRITIRIGAPIANSTIACPSSRRRRRRARVSLRRGCGEDEDIRRRPHAGHVVAINLISTRDRTECNRSNEPCRTDRAVSEAPRRSSGSGRAELRAAGAESAEALVEAGPGPGLHLAVARGGLVPGRFQILEPGVRLFDLEQLLRFAYRPGEGVVVIVHAAIVGPGSDGGVASPRSG